MIQSTTLSLLCKTSKESFAKILMSNNIFFDFSEKSRKTNGKNSKENLRS